MGKPFGRVLGAALLLSAVVLSAAPAQARDQIRIVGSSTVFPFSTAVAEHFGRMTPFRTPVVEATGSGGGIKLFCSGVGVGYPDIVNSSRPIKRSEFEACRAHGVDRITEVRVGFDGIVVASARGTPRPDFTRKDLFLALAREVPVDGRWIPNPWTRWSDIRPELPSVAIELLGPPPTSGTRDAFLELVMEPGCLEIPACQELKDTDPASFALRTAALREDGRFIDAGENDNLIVQKLEANRSAFGLFGFSFLEQNADKVQGAMIEGAEPTFESISSGAYTVSRSLFFYVKNAHAGIVPGLREFVEAFTGPAASGPEGYLADRGLIPLPEAEREATARSARDLVPMAVPED
ncbi:PstS family phosphate ABC transporter substrate-binding protein [Phaeovibrio sulfidiphilus]|uniref:PstS family phosphate ABC transporter substrate-binding protein n=1 Tax=Phaeovibrio sulfidiphilus TaxID=1220600 RepID=A0A8J6YI51_9PROT|nr:PstS family phosphate ABC transporter substrate-binding protein [Phaeovibrio sulfidiphilus]